MRVNTSKLKHSVFISVALSTFIFQSPVFAQSFPASAPPSSPPTSKDLPQTFPLSESKAKDSFAVDYSGFIRWDAFYSTRQPVSVREGLLYFYPQPEKLNAAGKDENADPFFNMLSVFTRGAMRISAPPLWGNNVSGYVEADFFGHLNSTISNLRLRHAYISFQGENTRLMLGQYWDVFTENNFFPGTINPGAGQPLQPFSRNPGAYFEWFPIKSLRVNSGLSMQRDAFSEFGALNDLQQHSGVPAASVSLTWKAFDNLKLGASAMGKAIRPAPTEENIYSGALQGFAEWQPIKPLRIRARGVWGTDMADHQMLGGFVKTKAGDYINLATASGWLDADYSLTDQWRVGLFGGYTANLGTLGETGIPDTFVARNPDQSWSMYIVPRVVYQANEHLRFSLEVNNTNSLYTKAYTNTIKPQISSDDKVLGNFHIALTSMLIF